MKLDGSDVTNMQDTELSKCEWFDIKDIRDMQLYSIANNIMKKLILPNVSDDGTWIHDSSIDIYQGLLSLGWTEKMSEKNKRFYCS